MATAHIESEYDDIAKTVLMPGDPLRAKFIADNFLTDVKIVNKVRNMYAYTGLYKNKKVTIFPSGMGIPSIGIYSYELFNKYDVEEIIRIGTCGTNKQELHLLDVILATSSYSLSTFPKLFDGDNINEVNSSDELNNRIIKTANSDNIKLVTGEVITSDIFDPYVEFNKYIKNYPNKDFVAMEMESFGLFYLAEKYNKKATCLLTVVDVLGSNKSATSDEREKSLKDMIKLALDSTL